MEELEVYVYSIYGILIISFKMITYALQKFSKPYVLYHDNVKRVFSYSIVIYLEFIIKELINKDFNYTLT